MAQGCFGMGSAGQPTGSFKAEGDRFGLLQEGSPRHNCVLVFLCEVNQSGFQTCQLGVKPCEQGANLQHGGGVHNILAGGAPMDKFGGLGVLGAHESGQLPYEGDGGVASQGQFRFELFNVQLVRIAAAGDGFGTG